MPLVDRIKKLKIPVTFVCTFRVPLHLTHLIKFFALTDGDRDWMDPKGGMESIETLRKAGKPHAKMFLIDNAGHHGQSSLF